MNSTLHPSLRAAVEMPASYSGFTTRPELAGTFGAVASTHWIASAVGMRVLEAGGNAFDAAVAAGFVLQIVEPHLNGPAGDVPILVARHDDAAPTVICGQGGSPAAATIEHFESLGLDLIPGTGLLAACVPGAFGAWLTMLRDWGTISLRAALESAIGYARQGHPILGAAVQTIRAVEQIFKEEWPTSAAVFLPGGRPPEPGTLFSNHALADLYEAILANAEATSADRIGQIDAALTYWYEGPVAAEIEHFLGTALVLDVSGRRHKGLLRSSDLHGWRPSIEAPLSVDFLDHTVFKCGAWSQGPVMLQALRMIEHLSVEKLDDQGADFVHIVAEVLKLAFADRDAWYGDETDVPVETLLDRGYACLRAQSISSIANGAVEPGGAGAALPVLSPVRLRAASGSDRPAGGGEPTFQEFEPVGSNARRKESALVEGDTCHLDVVDRWGNMVSATPSGGWLQSSPIIPKLGFALGTRLQMFWLHYGHPNSLAPRKRPRTTLTPSMAFKNGKPYLAFGTPGGDQQEQWSLLLFLRHVLFGHPLQRAIDAPAFHTDHLTASFWPRDVAPLVLTLESRFGEDVVAELRRRGHDVHVGGPWSEGRLSACSFEMIGGVPMIHAAANPRGMQGYAIAR